MNPDIPALLPVFTRLSRSAQPLVLATIVETEGSTYRKPGARMLIDAGGNWHGILGGGCFEGDLAERSARCLDEGTAMLVEYDMRGEGDLLWGLGLGCDGLVRILLQPLDPGAGYEPLGWLARLVGSGRRGMLATLLESANGLPAGASLGLADGDADSLGIDGEAARAVAEAVGALEDSPRPQRLSVASGGTSLDLLATPAGPAPHLLIVGAGPDAVPIARMARELHWQVSVLDHREAMARPDRFPPDCGVECREPEDLPAWGQLGGVSAALLMTHNFAADERWLRTLAAQPPGYLGLLGPARRRVKLLDTLDADSRARVEAVARGPVGLDIGGEMPGSIALAALAEIHAHLAGRSAGSLSRVGGR